MWLLSLGSAELRTRFKPDEPLATLAIQPSRQSEERENLYHISMCHCSKHVLLSRLLG